MLLLDGMALATQQAAGADFVNLPSTVVHSGTPIYHGLQFAAEFTW